MFRVRGWKAYNEVCSFRGCGRVGGGEVGLISVGVVNMRIVRVLRAYNQ